MEHATEKGAATSSSPRISTVLGTMTIPKPMGADAACEALDYFYAAGFDKIDTAILYQHGMTEATLGKIGMERFRVATKANPWYKDPKTFDFSTPTYGLKPDLVKEQLRASIKALGIANISGVGCSLREYRKTSDRCLFDMDVAITVMTKEPSLKVCLKAIPPHLLHTCIPTPYAVHEFASEGLFREWGISNYEAWETVDIWHICTANGWQTPSVYQGMYNAITRRVGQELLPALKKLGMRFYAYNPLASGFLTGKYSFDKPLEDGRFGVNTVMGGLHMGRGLVGGDLNWHKSIFDSIDNLKSLCKNHNIDLVSASFRWIRHHSALSGEMEDAVIICGSSVSQVKANVDVCRDESPLPKGVLDGFDAAWEASKTHSPSYFVSKGIYLGK